MKILAKTFSSLIIISSFFQQLFANPNQEPLYIFQKTEEEDLALYFQIQKQLEPITPITREENCWEKYVSSATCSDEEKAKETYLSPQEFFLSHPHHTIGNIEDVSLINMIMGTPKTKSNIYSYINHIPSTHEPAVDYERSLFLCSHTGETAWLKISLISTKQEDGLMSFSVKISIKKFENENVLVWVFDIFDLINADIKTLPYISQTDILRALKKISYQFDNDYSPPPDQSFLHEQKRGTNPEIHHTIPTIRQKRGTPPEIHHTIPTIRQKIIQTQMEMLLLGLFRDPSLTLDGNLFQKTATLLWNNAQVIIGSAAGGAALWSAYNWFKGPKNKDSQNYKKSSMTKRGSGTSPFSGGNAAFGVVGFNQGPSLGMMAAMPLSRHGLDILRDEDHLSTQTAVETESATNRAMIQSMLTLEPAYQSSVYQDLVAALDDYTQRIRNEDLTGIIRALFLLKAIIIKYPSHMPLILRSRAVHHKYARELLREFASINTKDELRTFLKRHKLLQDLESLWGVLCSANRSYTAALSDDSTTTY